MVEISWFLVNEKHLVENSGSSYWIMLFKFLSGRTGFGHSFQKGGSKTHWGCDTGRPKSREPDFTIGTSKRGNGLESK